jgi:hypothetical protein
MKMADDSNACVLFPSGSALISKHGRSIERVLKRETVVRSNCNGFGGD